jgi:hypothetical protein
MTLSPRHSTIGLLLAAVLIGACSAAAPSTSPSASPSAPAEATATPPASATPSPAPTASPTATPAPTASPTAAVACKIKRVTGPLPSDRLVNVTASTTADADVLTFHFGNMSVPGPGGPPRRELSKAKKPYTFGPSGKPIKMQGEHVAQVVFRGLSLQADTGDPVYTGPAKLTPGYPALKHAVEYDESEGVIGWYVGYGGTGCATLSRHGNDVMLTIAHS